MKLRCPACGASASVDVLIANDDARGAVLTALKLPAQLGPALIRYLGLFRPKSRELSMDRVGRLLGELQPMIQQGQITRDGRVWPAPLESWEAALEAIFAKDAAGELTRPLDGHGLLLEIIKRRAGKAEAQAERQTEERRQVAPEGRRTGQPVSVADAAKHIGSLRGALRGRPEPKPTE